MSARRAALFDLDRTLVRRETASLYVRHMRATGQATWRDSLQIAWWVAQYTVGVIDAPRVAAQAMSTYRGLPEVALAARCDDWVRNDVVPHIGDEARRAVRRHRERGDVTAIVTGASPYAAWPVARLLGIEHVVASEFEIVDHRLTGRPALPLCYGEGKVERASKLATEQGFRLDEACFYTDSYTDMPLLLAVAEPIVVNPDLRLAREARRRGWPVERW
ncbi:MAG: HAD-IB family hydrolase [Myxococcales bacterium]|nr:MAG: HAD-IB family hydrolase [Myxococcales bacterium]